MGEDVPTGERDGASDDDDGTDATEQVVDTGAGTEGDSRTDGELVGAERRGTAMDDSDQGYTEQDDRLALFEWTGMLTAGLGFFVPLLTLPVAAYCAYRIRDWKPVTAMLIGAVALTTVVFWLLVVIFVLP